MKSWPNRISVGVGLFLTSPLIYVIMSSIVAETYLCRIVCTGCRGRERQEEEDQMPTATEQHAADQFAKSLEALSDDALIDTYHQAAEDHRTAQAEGSDNIGKARAQMLAAKKSMRNRFPDYRARYKVRYP